MSPPKQKALPLQANSEDIQPPVPGTAATPASTAFEDFHAAALQAQEVLRRQYFWFRASSLLLGILLGAISLLAWRQSSMIPINYMLSGLAAISLLIGAIATPLKSWSQLKRASSLGLSSLDPLPEQIRSSRLIERMIGGEFALDKVMPALTLAERLGLPTGAEPAETVLRVGANLPRYVVPPAAKTQPTWERLGRSVLSSLGLLPALLMFTLSSTFRASMLQILPGLLCLGTVFPFFAACSMIYMRYLHLTCLADSIAAWQSAAEDSPTKQGSAAGVTPNLQISDGAPAPSMPQLILNALQQQETDAKARGIFLPAIMSGLCLGFLLLSCISRFLQPSNDWFWLYLIGALMLGLVSSMFTFQARLQPAIQRYKPHFLAILPQTDLVQRLLTGSLFGQQTSEPMFSRLLAEKDRGTANPSSGSDLTNELQTLQANIIPFLEPDHRAPSRIGWVLTWAGRIGVVVLNAGSLTQYLNVYAFLAVCFLLAISVIAGNWISFHEEARQLAAREALLEYLREELSA